MCNPGKLNFSMGARGHERASGPKNRVLSYLRGTDSNGLKTTFQALKTPKMTFKGFWGDLELKNRNSKILNFWSFFCHRNRHFGPRLRDLQLKNA